MHACVCVCVHAGGYLVEDADGLLLVAFADPRGALLWALESLEGAKHLEW